MMRSRAAIGMMTTTNFHQRAKEIHGDRFSYDDFSGQDRKQKIGIKCRVKSHPKFYQRRDTHLTSREPCPRCRSLKESRKNRGKKLAEVAKKQSDKSFDFFVAEMKKRHGDKYEYKRNPDSSYGAILICKEHGESKLAQRWNHLSGSICRKCSRKNSRAKTRTLTTEEFIRRAKCVHGDKYSYENTIYKNGYKDTVTVTCSTHGDFQITPVNHLYQKSGCRKCFNENFAGKSPPLTKESFEGRARKIHGDKYDYSLVDFSTRVRKVKIVCPDHGEFVIGYDIHLRGATCPDCPKDWGW